MRFQQDPEFEATLKAAEQGEASRQVELGRMYYYGDGVPKDHAEAAKWWRKAAEQGDDRAQYNLGIVYYYSEDVPKDYVEAYAWYSLYGQKKTVLRRLKAELTPEQLTAVEKR